MKIEVSQVKKVLITGIQDTDPITVILENYVLGKGKIIIQSQSMAVANYWPGMGDKTIEQFFSAAPDDYLMSKLFSGIDFIEDFCGFPNVVKAAIIKKRLSGDLDKDKAREYYDDVKDAIWDSEDDLDVSAMQEIIGDEWWLAIPKIRSPEYERLLKKVKIVKQALSCL